MSGIIDVALWKLLLIGGVTGIFSGLFGIGGGIVLIPILVFTFGFTQKEASATSLIAIALLPVGALGVYQYYKSDLITPVHFKIGILIGLGILFGGFFGAKLATHLPVAVLQKAFAALMIFGAYRLWMASLVR